MVALVDNRLNSRRYLLRITSVHHLYYFHLASDFYHVHDFPPLKWPSGHIIWSWDQMIRIWDKRKILPALHPASRQLMVKLLDPMMSLC